MDDRVNYWIEISDYDFETAKAMFLSSRYLYVGFMCHQTIEKILKACFCSKNPDPVPYTHSLSYIAKKADIYEQLPDDYQNFLDILEPLNIEARYPSQKERLMKSLTKEKCQDLLNKTKELQTWIKKRL
jgi:HEPN domain-containing protein